MTELARKCLFWTITASFFIHFWFSAQDVDAQGFQDIATGAVLYLSLVWFLKSRLFERLIQYLNRPN